MMRIDWEPTDDEMMRLFIQDLLDHELPVKRLHKRRLKAVTKVTQPADRRNIVISPDSFNHLLFLADLTRRISMTKAHLPL